MTEYYEYQGLLLNAYEWAGGLGKGHKEVRNSQSARRREVKRGEAKVLNLK